MEDQVECHIIGHLLAKGEDGVGMHKEKMLTRGDWLNSLFQIIIWKMGSISPFSMTVSHERKTMFVRKSIGKTIREKVTKCIEELSQRLRIVGENSFLEGKSIRDIAERQGDQRERFADNVPSSGVLFMIN